MLTVLITAALVAAPTPQPATNTKCPVMGNPVNADSHKVIVRNREYFVCCPGCDKKILADPDKYLEKDGTPKNAKSKKK